MRTKPSRAVVALALVVLASGCTKRTAGPDAPPPSPTEAPSRERVVWADSLCSATARLESEQASGRELTTGPADEFTAMETFHYLGFIASTVTSLADEFGSLPEAGITEADRYVAGIAAGLADIEPDITELAGDASVAYQLPAAEQLNRVKQIVDLIESVKADGLPALVRKSPEVAAAYELAPRCEPLAPSSSNGAPLPPADDGTDLSACADGTCEVTLRGTATVEVGDFQFDVTVADGSVTVVHDYGGGGGGKATLGSTDGEASFGTEDEIVTVRLSGIDGDTAVVKFTKE